MKINNNIISIPPYISTEWTSVKAIHVEEVEGQKKVVIILNDDLQFDVPGLSDADIEKIFECHSYYLENKTSSVSSNREQISSTQQDLLSSFTNLNNLFGNIEGLKINPTIISKDVGGEITSFLRHDPAQSNSANLPSDILSRIASITKIIGDKEDILFGIEEPVANCNCFHCQIVRAMRASVDSNIDENDGEPVLEEDLKFREWDIKSIGDKLYKVVNPLDENEYYQVFLGDPIGCTCGYNNCEHIRSVLSS